MTRKLLFACIVLCSLSSCYYQVQRGETGYPNAYKARNNAFSGLKYLHKGNTSMALHQLKLAFQQDPTDVEVIDSLAYFYEKTGDIQAADEFYIYALNTGKQLAAANYNYGAFLCRNGRYSQSLIYLKHANLILNANGFYDRRQSIDYCSNKMRNSLGEEANWAYYSKQIH